VERLNMGWEYQSLRIPFKVQKNSRTGGVAQVVEFLPSKHEALSSNPNMAKKTKKTKKKKKREEFKGCDLHGEFYTVPTTQTHSRSHSSIHLTCYVSVTM
jgi:hypothetical protein